MLDGVVKQSKYPLRYHITPLKGLLNDPNGLVQFKGAYHVFYQLNPYGTSHENKAWGHMVSKNMVDWERKAIALAPSEYYDKDGIYSGSAVVKEGVLYLFYTGNVIEADGTKRSYQCYAISEDGESFEKKGPLFPHPEGYTRHVRDPKVWYSEPEKKWFLVLGAQTDDLRGTAIWYASGDLLEWEFLGEIVDAKSAAYMWECPDVFELDDQWLFLISPQGFKPRGHQFQNIYHSVYVPATFKEGRFALTTDDMKELDWGFEFYAPQTFQADDGRRILYAWMGVMESDKEQAIPTIAEGWVHGLTIPRELRFEDNKLKQIPVEELKMLRQDSHSFTLSESWEFKSEKYAYEIEMRFEEEAAFEVSLKDSTKLSYQASERKLILERMNWLTNERETRMTYLEEPLTDLQIFLDGSSIEVFANEGSAVATARFFEEGPLVIHYQGELKGSAKVYELN
ncbi:glycoside hydrolase family 32 protein [Jeotgalibaca sp. A127]|uniref:glycoside hydrolase family 32 protein n=1 Tax=Jeotgalibaca sp. A127 TaxID=3457324 RepID=UPI003FD23614